MQGWMNKFLTPAISSTTTLIHVFVVILFFENFYILTENKSLLEISIEFKTLQLKPFLLFFFFIAVSKFLWLIIRIPMSNFSIVDGDEPQKTTAHKSYITFLLPILIFSYLVLIEYNPKTSPISIENHFWYYKLYTLFWFFVALFSSLRFIFFSPESFMSEKAEDNS